MKLIAYDCESFRFDWMFVFYDFSTKTYTKIHNDPHTLKEFVTDDKVFIGFNSKHYDQWILKAILIGATPQRVKDVSNFIIESGRMPWEHHFLKGNFLKINNVDIMDDMQMGLSLKAIEGHLSMNIEESSIPFDIERPLTPEEIKETFKYCTHDVYTTAKIVLLRKEYLNTKIRLAKMGGIDPVEALGMTNAKLVAKFLKARPKNFNDERVYNMPKEVEPEIIPWEVLQFFDAMGDETITDEELWKSKLEVNLCGMPTTYGYGGIHGAIPQFVLESEE